MEKQKFLQALLVHITKFYFQKASQVIRVKIIGNFLPDCFTMMKKNNYSEIGSEFYKGLPVYQSQTMWIIPELNLYQGRKIQKLFSL